MKLEAYANIDYRIVEKMFKHYNSIVSASAEYDMPLESECFINTCESLLGAQNTEIFCCKTNIEVFNELSTALYESFLEHIIIKKSPKAKEEYLKKRMIQSIILDCFGRQLTKDKKECKSSCKENNSYWELISNINEYGNIEFSYFENINKNSKRI